MKQSSWLRIVHSTLETDVYVWCYALLVVLVIKEEKEEASQRLDQISNHYSEMNEKFKQETRNADTCPSSSTMHFSYMMPESEGNIFSL